MKRALCLILALMMAFACCACGSASSTTTPQTSTTTPAATTTPADTTAPADTTTPADYNIFEDDAAPVYNLIAYCSAPDNANMGVGAIYLCDLIRERSNGKIDYEYFGSAILGGEREAVEAVQLGDIDLMVGGPVIANFAPSFEIMNMPFLFNSREQAWAALDGAFGDAVLANLEEGGFYGIGWFENGFYDVMNGKVKEVTSYKDFAGLNIRTVESKGYQDGWIAVGANPVAMAASEVYTAVQNGTVDGICLGIPGTGNMGLHKAGMINYCIMHLYFGGLPIIVSKDSWDEMPEEYKALIKECMHEASVYEREFTWDFEEQKKAEFLEAGLNVQILDDDIRSEWKDVVTSYVYPKYPDIVTDELLALIPEV